MKLFLSWSGPVSHQIATILRDWIPLVLQSVEPYVSSEDIDKGTRWSSDIAKELEESRYGIICVTHQNLKAPWVNFEAGALSKTIEKSNVAPFLFNIKKSEVDGPLVQFQLTIYEKEDIRKLINSINKASDGNILDQIKLDKVFNQWWPSLKNDLDELLKSCNKVDESSELENPIEPINDSNSKILEELLELSRTQIKLLKSPEELLPPKYFEFLYRDLSPYRSGSSNAAIRDLYSQYRRLNEELNNLLSSDILDQEMVDKFVVLKEIMDRIGKPVKFLYSKNREKDFN